MKKSHSALSAALGLCLIVSSAISSPTLPVFKTETGSVTRSANSTAKSSEPAAPANPAPAKEAKIVVATIQPALKPLESIEARLDAAIKAWDPKGMTPDLYPAAKSRIREVQSRLLLEPKSKEASRWIQACSLFTEAAILELQTFEKQAEHLRLQAKRIAVLNELNATHEAINKLERGYASSLKSDLEEQKRKAAAAKEDAEKRFGELNSALIQVSRDARGTIISMSDILFDVGKATLTEDLKINLAKIAGILTIYKDANVVVEGHTDNVGGEEYNQKLSEKRASNVMEYLVTPGGVAATRLTSAGFGFSKPIADNTTKEGRQKNRRVDLIVLDKKPAP
jgi:outer membrane protein OmpA-like peptidoglycan-associated protein